MCVLYKIIGETVVDTWEKYHEITSFLFLSDMCSQTIRDHNNHSAEIYRWNVTDKPCFKIRSMINESNEKKKANEKEYQRILIYII